MNFNSTNLITVQKLPLKLVTSFFVLTLNQSFLKLPFVLVSSFFSMQLSIFVCQAKADDFDDFP